VGTFSFAARGGHIDVLRWAGERLRLGPEKVLQRSEGRSPEGVAVGAREPLPVG